LEAEDLEKIVLELLGLVMFLSGLEVVVLFGFEDFVVVLEVKLLALLKALGEEEGPVVLLG